MAEDLGPVESRGMLHSIFELTNQATNNIPATRFADLNIALLVDPNDGFVVDDEGRVLGSLRATGLRPRFLDQLKTLGVSLPSQLFRRAA